MEFKNTQVFNIEGALRGMRFPMKGTGDTVGNIIGPKDMNLACRLWQASETDNLAHSKFLRQIFVSVDIAAPLYFWSEMDTYKIGTTANSESTMHRLLTDSKNLSIDDFETYALAKDFISKIIIPEIKAMLTLNMPDSVKLVNLKQILPTSFIQKRHWTANYEVIRNICNQRKNHKLKEWHEDFINWARTLPYSNDFIFGEVDPT